MGHECIFFKYSNKAIRYNTLYFNTKMKYNKSYNLDLTVEFQTQHYFKPKTSCGKKKNFELIS